MARGRACTVKSEKWDERDGRTDTLRPRGVVQYSPRVRGAVAYGTNPYARQMNQPLALALASLVASAAFLAGCSEPPADNPSNSKPSAQKQEGADGPDPDRLPIAYQDDGKTLRECREWNSLGDDLQHGMAFRAIAESEMGPVTEAKIESVRKVIDNDCAENPKDVLWNVAVRGAMLL